jgi:hypothetical protein
MFRWVAFALTVLLVSASSVGAPRPSEGELTIVVRTNSVPPSFRTMRVTLRQRNSTVVNLDLGEDIDDQEIKLSTGGRYRVFERYRTSMTVMDEGPHLDLIDWRHFDSSWTLLKSLDHTRCRTLSTNRIDGSRFPRVTKADMVRAVRARTKQEWGRAAQLIIECSGPNDYPCAVMLSSIFIRVERRVQGKWAHVGLVEFRIPMGC